MTKPYNGISQRTVMKNYMLFQDAEQGFVSLPDSGKQYIKTKDATSKSGHSLMAQIEMTHSGIITRNLGFYLPGNMKDGAGSFNQHFNKPVIIGHDDDADPVGRVIDARYVDTSKELRMNDKYLSSLIEFHDKKRNKESVMDFVHHVVKEYWGKDSYRGLGHIRGYLKISDEETIAKILDERYLTVSTSMTSDAARCSECGQDWISEGPCDHDRGQIYDSGVPTMLVPGNMRYNHLGIVTEPADVFAAKFSNLKMVKNDKVTDLKDSAKVIELQKEFNDKYSYAANLFSYKDGSKGKELISLSDESGTNLIDIKNEIQDIEDSIRKTESDMFKVTKDNISAVINLYKSQETEEGNMESSEVTVRKYVYDLDESMLAELANKAMSALDSKEFETEEAFNDAVFEFLKEEAPEVTEEDNAEPEKVLKSIKVLNDKFKIVDGEETYDVADVEAKIEEITAIKDHGLNKRQIKELANILVRQPLKDALYSIELEGESLEDKVKTFKSISDSRVKLTDCTEEDILNKMNEILGEDSAIKEQTEIVGYAGSSKYFPIADKASADAARELLKNLTLSDSLRARILGNLEKIASQFVDETEVAENFDNDVDNSDNKQEFSDEELVAKIEELRNLADERGIELKSNDSDVVEKDQEIAILEAQLDAANDEVETLTSKLNELKDEAKKALAEKVVDAKIEKGILSKENKEKELEDHLERSEDSLNDSLKDLGKIKDTKQANIADLDKVENPTINDSTSTANEEVEEETNNDTVSAKDKKLKRSKALLAANKGRGFADKYFKGYNN